jgi:hypothetical protein
MTMWEYDQINLNELPRKMNALDFLNDAGAEGWELVTLTALNIAILKRPVPKPDQPWKKAFFARELSVVDSLSHSFVSGFGARVAEGFAVKS